MAKARSLEGLDAEQPYASAAARIVEVRAGEISEHADRVLDLDDIEGVHDMRVATRRLRAALEVFEPCFPRKRFKRALNDVKALADALGERRDRDVAIAALGAVASSFGSSDRAGVESLIAALRGEQLAANEGLAPYVSRERLAELRARLLALAAAARQEGEGAPGDSEGDGRPADGARLAASSAANGAGDP